MEHLIVPQVMDRLLALPRIKGFAQFACQGQLIKLVWSLSKKILKLGANVINIYGCNLQMFVKCVVFVHGRLHQVSLIFVGKARAYQHLEGASLWYAPALLAAIRLSWNGSAMTFSIMKLSITINNMPNSA